MNLFTLSLWEFNINLHLSGQGIDSVLLLLVKGVPMDPNSEKYFPEYNLAVKCGPLIK